MSWGKRFFQSAVLFASVAMLAPWPAKAAVVPTTTIDAPGLYVMNADGTNLRRLVTGSGVAYPSWSPDGTRISYQSSTASLSVVNLRGRTTAVASNAILNRLGAAWDPTGSRLAYPGPGSGYDRDAWIASTKGKKSDGPLPNAGDDAEVDWSSSGRLASMGTNGLWAFNADNSGRTQLLAEGLNFGMVRWSHDGTKVVAVPDMQSNHRILNSDGTNVRTLAGDRPNMRIDSASWSPDGTRLVIDGYDFDLRVYGTWVTTTAGASTTLLSAGDSYPEWSPGGNQIAVVTSGGPNPAGGWTPSTMWSLDPDGTARTLLVSGSSTNPYLYRPAFSPDGSQIAFAAA